MSQKFMTFPSTINPAAQRLVVNNQAADEARRLDLIERQLEALVSQLQTLSSHLPKLQANAAVGQDISWSDYLAQAEAGQVPSFDPPTEKWVIVNNVAEPLDANEWVDWKDYVAAQGAIEW